MPPTELVDRNLPECRNCWLQFQSIWVYSWLCCISILATNQMPVKYSGTYPDMYLGGGVSLITVAQSLKSNYAAMLGATLILSPSCTYFLCDVTMSYLPKVHSHHEFRGTRTMIPIKSISGVALIPDLTQEFINLVYNLLQNKHDPPHKRTYNWHSQSLLSRAYLKSFWSCDEGSGTNSGTPNICLEG